ncbi:MAG: hypothetical protein CL676_03195 [Bdellovibrionaceae bacterium]|nr:hypothetical protein [Pseudobdellovibrionaceae bacterium]
MKRFVQGAFVLWMSFGVLSACGPELSIDDQKDQLAKEEKDRQEKLNAEAEREKLLRLAEAREPKVRQWEGCYVAQFNNGGIKKVILQIGRSNELVSPGSNLEPVRMPLLRAAMIPTSSAAVLVPFPRFAMDEDASFIQYVGEKNLLELNFSPEGKHAGFYQGAAMSYVSEISLVPTTPNKCE